MRGIKHFGSVCVTTFLSFFLIFVITGVIIATSLTVYVLGFMEETSEVTLRDLEMSYSTFIYGTNNQGELQELYKVENEVKRIPVEIDQIPQHVRDAFVYAEDERFYTHDGVDYKRTTGAVLNMFLHFWATEQGGSTITQQLIKNITGDKQTNAERKIREIFRAMQFEKKYSKDEILEAYLNYIGFGGSANGVQMASLKYFGKDVSELTVAEAACLAAIPKNPEKNNPFAYYIDDQTGERVVYGREKNRSRQEYVLRQMYDNGAISFDTYQQALAEKMLFTDTEEYKQLHPEADHGSTIDEQTATSWVVDTAIYEYADILMDQYGISKQEAISRINKGGYQIYTTVNMDMQAYVEGRYSDLNNLLSGMTTANATCNKKDRNGDGVVSDEEKQYLQSAFCAVDYSGNILAIVGSTGAKNESLSWNFATDPQQPGSSIKPVTTYGYALSNDLLHWGTKLLDAPPLTINGKKWPTNYSSDGHLSYTNNRINVYYALQKSYNTIPALICKEYGTLEVFSFATEKLGLQLDGLDNNYAPLAVGALTQGISIENLANAYMVYGNGGIYSKAHIISRVEAGDGTLLYTGGTDIKSVVDEETSTVMNKLLQNVVNAGTGTAAKLTAANGAKIPIAGKTGTTSNWFDLTFVGLCPDFVSAIWLGYEENSKIVGHGSIKSAGVWKNAIGGYIKDHYSGNDFFISDKVISAPMCTSTGCIAGASCPKGITGYWKSTNAPKCPGHSAAAESNTSTPSQTPATPPANTPAAN